MTKERAKVLALLASGLFAVGMMGLIACADDGTKYGLCSEPTDFTSINTACAELIKTTKTHAACESAIVENNISGKSYRTCIFEDATATCKASDIAIFEKECSYLPIGAKDAASAKKACEMPIKINGGGATTTAHCIFQPNAA